MKNNLLKRMGLFVAAVFIMGSMLTACGNGEKNNSSDSVVEESTVESSVEESVEEEVSGNDVSGSDAEENESTDAPAPAVAIYEEFKEAFANGGNSLEEITQSVIENTKTVPFDLACYTVAEEGFLNGFQGDVTGFNEAVCFGPIIGSIPYIGYIFETDDTVALMETLQNQAKLNWNICTEADGMYMEALDENHVFFAMTPSSVE